MEILVSPFTQVCPSKTPLVLGIKFPFSSTAPGLEDPSALATNLGINIPSGIVDPFLNELKDILEDDFDEYVALQKNRDGGHYHITVMPVMEYNRLSKSMGIDKFVNSLEIILKHSINDIKLMGIGTATNIE